MRCPQCGELESAVIDSRIAEDHASVRRRRECVKCNFRFTTYERAEQPRLMVIKKDSSRELFERDKLSAGIYKAFYKRPLSAADIEKVIDDIERAVYELNREEVNSAEIGEIVISKLEQVDSVAYIRFAAVYRKFTDLETFEKEIQKLIGRKATNK
ncbi:MAG: transcriptional regulator NrdR [Patescibacteria group bacterium]|jgi:transcriptional repressor NrdR